MTKKAINFKPYWMERYYRVYDVETGKTEALFAEQYDAEMFAKDFKRNRIRIECWDGVLE